MGTMEQGLNIAIHKLATDQIVALGYSGNVSLGTTKEDEYLAFYEKIFNKLKALAEAS